LQSSAGEGLTNDCEVVPDCDDNMLQHSRLPSAPELGWNPISPDHDDNFGLTLLHELTVAGCDCAEHGGLAGHFHDSPVSLPTGIPTHACSSMTSPVGDLHHKSAGSTALHALDAHLCVHSLSRSEFYLNICAVETDLLGPDAPLRAHTDGGSMATTTDRHDYLWDY
jgi:hypothetical protein